MPPPVEVTMRCFIYASIFVCATLCTPATRAQFRTASYALHLGDSLYFAFDNAHALAQYRAAFRADSNGFGVRLRLARTHYDYGLDRIAAGDLSDARSHFESAVRHARALNAQYPERAETYVLLAATTGNLAMFAGGREKVLLGRQVAQYSRQAIAMDSTQAYAYVALGLYHREVARLNGLERLLARLLFGALPDPEPEDILVLLHHAERLRPESPFLQYELAITYAWLRQCDLARAHLIRLQALSPETTQDIRNQQRAVALIDRWRRPGAGCGL